MQQKVLTISISKINLQILFEHYNRQHIWFEQKFQIVFYVRHIFGLLLFFQSQNENPVMLWHSESKSLIQGGFFPLYYYFALQQFTQMNHIQASKKWENQICHVTQENRKLGRQGLHNESKFQNKRLSHCKSQNSDLLVLIIWLSETQNHQYSLTLLNTSWISSLPFLVRLHKQGMSVQ